MFNIINDLVNFRNIPDPVDDHTCLEVMYNIEILILNQGRN